MVNILVVGDPHARQGVSMRRFTWLGKLIKDSKPDYVVNMGDHWDFPSLSAYDKGKRCFEGRRYQHDLNAGHEALEAIDSACKGWRGKRFILKGNHEHRIVRAVEDNAMLEGTLGLNDLENSRWESVLFLENLELEGVLFSHYYTSGRMGYAISGENPAKTLIMKQLRSCVMGHSHIFDYATRTDAKGKRVTGLVAGCYLDPQQYEDYAGPQGNRMFWKGVVMLTVNSPGSFDMDQISISRLEAAYGK